MSSAQVAVVTGVSRGFGRAITLDLLRAGWVVVGDGRDNGTLQRLSGEAGDAAESLHAVPGDIHDDEHLEQLVTTSREIGDIALVVNNAGDLGPTPLPNLMSVEIGAVADLFRVNVLAPLRLLQLAVPAMNAGSAVINISSDAATNAYGGWGPYGASKAALDQITAVLAVERPDLRWYSLDPGDMRTDMHQAAFPDEDISDRPLPEESAPAVLKLVEQDYESGRYAASDLLSPTA